MKQTHVFAAAAILLLVAAIGVFAIPTTKDQSMVETTMQGDTQIGVEEMAVGQTTGEETATSDSMPSQTQYLVFSQQALEDAASSRRVLFFYANWCPTCQPADRDFSQNTELLPDDVTVIRVNYNDNQTDEAEKSLAQKYGVTYQHTYVQIDQNGNEVAKWNGGSLEELLENIQ